MDKKGAKYNFIPSTFNGMEDYENLLLMRLLLRSRVVFVPLFY